MIRPFRGRTPSIHPSAFVEPSAEVVGEVSIGAGSSVWHQAVLRGDINRIEIGQRSNVQDGSVLHVTREHAVRIEDDVTLGHRVVVHGATIRSGALIGIGAIVLDGAEVGEHALIAAGAVVTPGTRIAPRTLAAGIPARPVREMTAAEIDRAAGPARNYVGYAAEYRREYGQA